MKTPRPRKIINMSLDPDLVDWLNEWRNSQMAVVPFGRAVDACIRALRETENPVKRAVPKGKASKWKRHINPQKNAADCAKATTTDKS